MNPETHLYLLRHGEVESRYHRVFGGRIDMELSPLGHDQASALAGYLHARNPEVVYASPMKRARQTLDPFLKRRSMEPVVMHEFREVDFGDWTGLSWDQVREKFNTSAFEWLTELEQGRIPNAERHEDFRKRVEAGIRHIFQNHEGRSVAVVCHGGVIRMILSILLEVPLSRMSMFEIDYATLTHVRCRPNKPEIHLLNYAPWRQFGKS